MSFEDDLIKIYSMDRILLNEPMKNHTSFKVGGAASCLVLPKNSDEIVETIKVCKKNEIPYYILGNGSNVIVKDRGFKGVIIKLAEYFSNIEIIDTDIIKASSGILLSTLANFAMKNELSGLEFASGIPGTLGGAVFMNAGAYGGEIKDVLIEAHVIDSNYNIIRLKNEDLDFGYRTSIVQKENYIVIDASLKLNKGTKEHIASKMKELNQKRRDKQPLEYPSAGSTFKRPEGYFAGKLIMDCGLRGAKIGGAMVSEKHCGFIINENNATAKDIIELINYVKKTVYNTYKIELEQEVKIIGD